MNSSALAQKVVFLDCLVIFNLITKMYIVLTSLFDSFFSCGLVLYYTCYTETENSNVFAHPYRKASPKFLAYVLELKGIKKKERAL